MSHGDVVRPLPLVVLAGELDLMEAPAVRVALSVLDGPGVVDMTEVRYLDSSALAELALVARRVGKRKVTLVVTSRNVRKLLDIVHFDTLFHIVDRNANAGAVA